MTCFREFPRGFKNIILDIRPWGIPRVHFIKSEWELPKEADRVSWPYFLWRGSYALFCASALILSITVYADFWLVYLTHWSLLLQTIYSLVYFVDLLIYRLQPRGNLKAGDNSKLLLPDLEEAEIPRKINTPTESAIWISSGIVGSLSIFVTLVYWAFIFPYENYQQSFLDFSVTITSHGINAFLALIDITIIAIPVRITQSLFLVVFALSYGIFSYIYEISGGAYPNDDKPYIYSFLNWRENYSGALVSCAISGVGALLLHLILWLLYIFRLRLVSQFSCRADRESCRELHRYWRKKSKVIIIDVVKSSAAAGDAEAATMLTPRRESFVETNQLFKLE